MSQMSEIVRNLRYNAVLVPGWRAHAESPHVPQKTQTFEQCVRCLWCLRWFDTQILRICDRADRADVLLDFIMWKELWVELVGLETGDRTRCSRCILHNMRWVPICGASWNWKDHSGCWRGGLPGFPLPLQSSYATSKHDSLQDSWQFLSVVHSATMLGASEMIEMWSAAGLR